VELGSIGRCCIEDKGALLSVKEALPMSSLPEPEGHDRDPLEIGVWVSIAAVLLLVGGWTLTDILGRFYM
jgi:hypothetical protein